MPVGSELGRKIPEKGAPLGSVQVPVLFGLPPNEPKSANGVSEAHTVMLPLVPAFGC